MDEKLMFFILGIFTLYLGMGIVTSPIFKQIQKVSRQLDTIIELLSQDQN